jgi:hypothetical protein
MAEVLPRSRARGLLFVPTEPHWHGAARAPEFILNPPVWISTLTSMRKNTNFTEAAHAKER